MRKYDFLVAVSVVTDLTISSIWEFWNGLFVCYGGRFATSMGPNTNSTCFLFITGLAKSLIGNKNTDPMTSTFFEQRASYFFANNKKDKHFTVDAIGVFMCDEDHHNGSLDLIDSDTSSPTSNRSHFFMSSSSSSSSADDDLVSESDASEGTSASSAEESFTDELYHIEKPIKITSDDNLMIQNESERLVLYNEESEAILSQSPSQFDSILAAAAENDQPLPMSLADVSHDGTSIEVKTGPSGFFQDNIVIPHSCIDAWAKDAANPRVIQIKASSTDASMGAEDCFGLVNLLEPTGISVVSDIDDTIKDTQVLCGAKTVLRNTFFKAAVAVDGMAETYKTMVNISFLSCMLPAILFFKGLGILNNIPVIFKILCNVV